MFPVTHLDARPACADRLDLVDAAFARPGKSDELRALCADCPVATACLSLAMTRGEHGVWGGTGPKVRTQHGAPSASRMARGLRR
jgi:hypothetical protein